MDDNIDIELLNQLVGDIERSTDDDFVNVLEREIKVSLKIFFHANDEQF